MIIITSPAKTLDFESRIPDFSYTDPLFLDQASILIAQLQKESVADIQNQMHISPILAATNYTRYHQWTKKHTLQNSRPALFAYRGDIYRQMFPYSYSQKQIEYAQENLRIISGLYGLVRPLDLIEPYRLEMKIFLKTKSAKTLYTFWKKTLTLYLNAEMKAHKHTHLIDLASHEYSKSIDLKHINVPVVTIHFRQEINGKIKNEGLFAKKARGMMIEFMIQNNVQTVEELEPFTTHGYHLSSKDPLQLTFTTDRPYIEKGGLK